jgi:hypothetical protein
MAKPTNAKVSSGIGASITLAQLSDVARVLFLAPSEVGNGQSGIIWGLPGVGKSALVKALADRYGLPKMTLSPALLGDGAFGVVPVPQGDMLGFPRPSWTSRFDEKKVGVVFIDEATSEPRLLAPVLGLTLDRMVGDHFLGEGVRVIAAANPPHCAVNGADLPPPVANRLAHFVFDGASPEGFGSYLLSKRAGRTTVREPISLEDDERQVREGWDTHYPRVAATVASFLKARPELLHVMPAASDPNASGPWPSHRSWDMLVNALTTCAILGYKGELPALFTEAWVGSGAATEFLAYAEANDLPDPAAVLDGTVTWEHSTTRPDRTYAVLAACAATVAPDKAPKRDARTARLWGIIGKVVNVAPDLAVTAVAELRKAGLARTAEAVPVLMALKPTFERAKVNG